MQKFLKYAKLWVSDDPGGACGYETHALITEIMAVA